VVVFRHQNLLRRVVAAGWAAGLLKRSKSWSTPNAWPISADHLGANHGSVTATGTVLQAVASLPSWPNSLSPQHQTAPSVRIPQECREPAEILSQSPTATTCVGIDLFSIVSSPS